ncbi:MAG: PEGA domain-containing protein [Fidelibacterota bacterium]|nr:MAG: PEGA domain-containing protein [Candidatus Neomarinimicrobiota bacterium]
MSNQQPFLSKPFCLLACLAAIFSLNIVSAQSGESLAILDLEGRGISAVEAASLTDRLRAALVRTQRVTVVERGQMERILSEQDFQLTGCTSDECAVEVGQLLGVTVMVAGSVGRVGATYSVDIRAIEVQSGRITHSLWRDYRGEIDGLLGIMPEIAQELVNAMGAAAAEAPAIPAAAVLVVHSEPPGAQVVLNNVEIGTTPLDSLELAANTVHSLTLNLNSYRSMDTTIVALAGQVHEVVVALEPLPSRVSIISTPAGAGLVLDGQARGVTPLTGMEVGGTQSHRAALSLGGYYAADTTFYTAADQDYTLNVALERLPIQLSIQSTPSGATVFLNRRNMGQTPVDVSEAVASRQYTLALRLDGYQPKDTSFVARAGEHHRISMRLSPVRAVAARPEQAPPPSAPTRQPAVAPAKKGGGGLLALIVLGAVGYYGYTEGWFDEWIHPPEEEGLRVGNPPGVPAP